MFQLQRGKQEVIQIHTHTWFYQGRDTSGERCACGNIKVTADEIDRREQEWTNYYGLVRDSWSFKDFQDMKKAFFSRNGEVIKGLIERIEKRLEKDDYMSHPNFPDPSTWKGYHVES